MENPIKMDDLEVRYPYFRKPPYVFLIIFPIENMKWVNI